MKYTTNIQAFLNSPENLESLYQSARQANEEAEFRTDFQEVFDKSPDNILLAAWNARFMQMPLLKVKRTTNWLLAVILGLVTGAILWAISDPSLTIKNGAPYITLLWSPIATIPTLIFLSAISKRNYLYTGLIALALIVAGVYALVMAPRMSSYPSNDYLILMLFVLPLLCWMGLGIAVLKFKSSTNNRFSFLIKSIEVIITAGVYLIFGVAFGMITIAMFAALNVTFPDVLMRLAVAGGFGLIPIMAVATMYDPLLQPEAQDFSQGLSKFIFTMMRLLLPLTLIVLVIYLLVIPFNFMAPFQNRNLLIVYNVMQFAIIGLLIGATPLKLDDLSEKLQTWLRRGILAVAILALVVSLYALSAVVYRTVGDVLTLNRLTIIGWNIINIAILFVLIYTQFTKTSPAWHERLQHVFSRATTVYLIWSVFLVLALPLIFR
ncbi:MAG: hypothetical protein C3F13_11990 [Anaerolineales bacterium]|nr:MAG: hypothetical protein C3F13_11990 [Anaerolineales bacterium]